MSRWSQYDEDDYRLPEGMTRVGYDADTQVYTYQDEDGQYWEGEPGNRYGQLHRTSDPTPTYHPPSNPAYTPRDNSWRYLAPFFLLICLFLLLVYTLVGGGLPFRSGSGTPDLPKTGLSNSNGGSTGSFASNPNNVKPGLGGTGNMANGKEESTCAVGQDKYMVRKGDSCWEVAKRYGMSVQQLVSMNGEASCESLRPGMRLCVKGVGGDSGERDG